MTRAGFALVAVLAYAGIAVGLRAWLQRRWTGASGLVGVRPDAEGRRGAPAVAAATLFGAAFAGIAAAPILAIVGAVGPVAIAGAWAAACGSCLLAAGMGGVLWAQFAMGPAWRIGVDPDERTALVTAGPFRWVRNPIYSSMVLFDAGIALLIPSVVAVAALIALVVAVEVQVRLIEEPHLLRWHGDAYRHWLARTGRFSPMGRQSGQGEMP
jgi:protein-S-isoprenylcysteine O-methyltransferase Ste14